MWAGLRRTAPLRKYIGMERNSAKIKRRLESEGWALKSVRGSHHKFVREGKVVILVHPKKDVSVGVARDIAKKAGWL